MTTLTRTAINEGFRAIEAAAIAGERAPTTRTLDNPSGTMRAGITSALLKEGRIRAEIYGQNSRVIEILKGPHAGKRTKGPPDPNAKPYKVLPAPTVTLARVG